MDHQRELEIARQIGMPVYSDLVRSHQLTLADELRRAHISEHRISDTLESGYFVARNPEQQSFVIDGFYRDHWIGGSVPLDVFIDYLQTGEYEPRQIPEFVVHGPDDITDIITSEPLLAPAFDAGWMTFRGQPREYALARPVPHPRFADVNGDELLLLPSWWRRFVGSFNDRYGSNDRSSSIFIGPFAERLIFHGLPEAKELIETNLKRYGPHRGSDLEDFPDATSQEWARRRYMYEMLPEMIADEFPLLEQHYGIATDGLDLTFNPRVALFFALHRFTTDAQGAADYIPDTGHNNRTVYAFVFRSPPIKRSKDLVDDVEIFDHIPPTRPIRQECALPLFSILEINAAAGDVAAKFLLADDFDQNIGVNKEWLFPGPQDDAFYGALMAEKEHNDMFRNVVTYSFH